MTLKQITQKYLFYFFIGMVLFFGVLVRFQDLGYSNFQGDEINAISYLGTINGKNPDFKVFYDFLLNQYRGPGQYIINYINTSILGFISEFQIRFPFFVFSVLAFFSIYLFTKKIFNDIKTALIASAFLALNGLYLAFGRITQYQSFMYFLIPLSLYVYLKGFGKKDYRVVALSGFMLSICLLFHYDTLSVGAFFVGFIVYNLYTNPRNYKFIILSSLVFLLWFLIPSVAFYSQFIQGAYYEESTSGYLSGRLFGFGLMPRTPYVELGKLLTLYMPAEAWLLSFFSVCFGLLFLVKNIAKFTFFRIKLGLKHMQTLYIFFVGLYAFALLYSIFPIKPRLSTVLIYLCTAFFISILFLSKKIKAEHFGVVTWFLLTFATYFFFIKDPRTHVYVTFMPGFLLAAFGVKNLIFNKNVYIRIFSILVYSIYSLYLFAFYYVVFINKNPEYPWFKKSVFSRELYEVKRSRHSKIDGVFGFNNSRHWSEIGLLYKKGCLVGSYSSNEKDLISKFYLGFSQKNPESAGLIYGNDTLIYVQGPHSWYYAKVEPIIENPAYSLIKTYKNGDYIVTYIFGKKTAYPNGIMFCE